ncbi:hypothetical protein OEZ85_003199 [Tetradesmus obliquus]|uniref:Tyrosine-protein kinase ephrin type A/B receptor-like domain-containing protein n=1 Tax=Tetradesmus obliquus TaxID=3088 RepID=A0ABY8U2N7_TETOB|nr:hypothetical protein OEZ85_003199 [Tetradesmus obliquus]
MNIKLHVLVVLLAVWTRCCPATGLGLQRAERELQQLAMCPEGCDTESPGSCVHDGTTGGFLCMACKVSTGRIAAADGTCGCRPGYYLAQGSCALCLLGSFCPGGSAAQSTAQACGDNLTTINKGSTSSFDCVTEPGFRLVSSTGTAAGCLPDTYNPGKNRLTECIPCPASFSTNTGEKKKSVYDCLLMPGWRAIRNFNAVRCAKGQYREGFVRFSTDVACSLCPSGTDTERSVSTSLADCRVLLPGWRWTGGQQQANSQAEQCPWHRFCPGGVAAAVSDGSRACPSGLWTKQKGAASERDCLVPPGHFLSKTGPTPQIEPCSTGEQSPTTKPGGYQPLWLDAANIRQGQGLVFDSSISRPASRPAFRAVFCSGNHYGTAAERRYNLTLRICKSCPPGTGTNATDCDESRSQCPNTATGGFFSIAACRYPSGATCGSIQGGSMPARNVTCTRPLVLHAGKASQNITGMTQVEATNECCCQPTCNSTANIALGGQCGDVSDACG